MFPETFPERWIDALTKPGDLVLDPFSGRGTTAFQALLMGRQPVANDINPVAYCITKAKVSAPALNLVQARLTFLESAFRSAEPRLSDAALSPNQEFFRTAFSPQTLTHLLFLRESLSWRAGGSDTVLAAIALGVLHGESQRSGRYLSNQMPRTISTKPAYSLRWWKGRGLIAPDRDVFEILRREVSFRYASGAPDGKAEVFHGDMRDLGKPLSGLPRPIGLVVTSPPYMDTTSYEEDQWLRLWFLGGTPYPTRGLVSPDDRISRSSVYWAMILDFWRVISGAIAESGNVVIRLGARNDKPSEVVEKLQASSAIVRRRVSLVSSEVTELRRRQTNAFRPGSTGHKFEVDCHFRFD